MNEQLVWEDQWNTHLVKIAREYSAFQPVYVFLRQWMLLSPIPIVSFFEALGTKTWIDPLKLRKIQKKLKRYSKQDLHSFLSLYFLDYLNYFADNQSLHTVVASWDMTPTEFIERCLSALSVHTHKRLPDIWDRSVIEKDSFYHTITCLEWLGIYEASEPTALLFEELKTQLYRHFDNFLLKVSYTYDKHRNSPTKEATVDK